MISSESYDILCTANLFITRYLYSLILPTDGIKFHEAISTQFALKIKSIRRHVLPY